jgi:hypothetical protein
VAGSFCYLELHGLPSRELSSGRPISAVAVWRTTGGFCEPPGSGNYILIILAGGKRVARLFNIQTYWQIQKVLFPVAF